MTTVQQEIAIPPLNDEQTLAILTESVSRGFFELDVDGQMPQLADERLDAAQNLVGQARLAYMAGQRGEDVMALLFLAEVDLQPDLSNLSQPSEVAPSSALSAPMTKEETVSATTETVENQFADIGDELLPKIEKSMMNYEEQTDEIRAELAQIKEEMQRRGLPSAQNGSDPVVASPAPERGEEAAPAVADATTEDPAARAALEDCLTVGIMRKHGIDPSEIGGISTETLQWIVDHPDGGEPLHLSEAQVREGTSVPTPGSPPQEPSVSQPDPLQNAVDAAVETVSQQTISAEREALEAQVTGPLLKVYGRGRKDVPSIGDHELAFMVANPDGRVTKEMLLAERAKDEAGEHASSEPAHEPTIAEQTAADAGGDESDPKPEADGPQIEGEQRDAFAPPADPEPETEKPKRAPAATPAAPPIEASAERAREQIAALGTQELSRAQEIIERERLPIPPEITEDPPVLPFDMSKVGREELYSLHARFHACESRTNWVLSHEEDTLGDIVKLRRGREVEVANALPATIERKKLTESQRENLIAADEEVREYVDAEHEIAKTIRKLKVLRDSYHKDVERASRQLTQFAAEYGGGK